MRFIGVTRTGLINALGAVSRNDAEVIINWGGRRRRRIAEHGWEDRWAGSSFSGQMAGEMRDCGEE